MGRSWRGRRCRRSRGRRSQPPSRGRSGVIVYRFSAPLIFSNAEAFTTTGEGILIEAATKGPLPHTVVIDFEEVFLIDDTGAVAIINLFEYAQRYGVELSLARVHAGTHEILRLSGVTDEIGEHRIIDTVRNAVAAATKGGSSSGDSDG